MHLEHIDHVDIIARLDTRIDEARLPFVAQTSSLRTIPGIGERSAQVIGRSAGRVAGCRPDPPLGGFGLGMGVAGAV
jgi:transposase